MQESQYQKIEVPIEQQNQNDQPLQIFQSKKSDIISQHVQKYLALMDLENINQYKEHQLAIQLKLKRQNLIDNFDQENIFHFKIVDFTTNYQYLLVEVQYSHFQFRLKILNIDQESGLHKSKKCFFGNFSKVYEVINQGKRIAVKCSHYKSQTFSKVFKNVLLQFVSIIIVNTFLNSGPKLINIYGFDLMVYNNCIEFSQQFCRHQLRLQTIERDLKQSLINLHCLKMIHFDIKPENICFSQKYNRNVFIDFGLHTIIKEGMGYKSMTLFRGSLLFCSQQMKQCFLKGESMIDLYYNDAFCLKKSIEQIKSKPIKHLIKHNRNQVEQVQIQLLIKLKYALTNISFNQQVKQFFSQGAIKLSGFERQSLQQFFSGFIQCQYYKGSQRLFETPTLLKNLYSQYKENICKDSKRNKQQNIFKKKINELRKLSQCNFKTAKFAFNDCLSELIKFMSDIKHLKTQEIPQYLQIFSQMIQINSWKVNLSDRNKLYNAFNRLFLKITNFEQLQSQQKVIKCFTKISEFIQIQSIMDDVLFQIIRNSLLSIILLEIYTQQRLFYLFSKIMLMECSIQKIARLNILFLSCVEWIKYIDTSYCSCSLKDHIYRIIISKEIKITQNQGNSQKFLVRMINFLVQLSPLNQIQKLSKLQSILKTIYFQKNFSILNYYQQNCRIKQIIAQYFVYFVCLLHSGFRQTSFIDELLKLHFHQQQQEMNIFHYYEFTICYIIVAQGKQKKQLIDSLLSSIRENFKCFEKQSQFFYINDNKIIFRKLDLTKIKNSRTLKILYDAFQFYYKVVFQQDQKFNKYIIDKESLLVNMNIDRVYKFLSHTIAISKLEFYQHFEYLSRFKEINHILCKYIVIMQKIGIYNQLKQTRDHIITQIQNLSIKNRVQFLVIHLAQFSQQGMLFDDQQEILSLIFWIFKVNFIQKEYAFKLIKALCLSNSKKYAFLKLYIYYIMQSNYHYFFRPSLNINVDFQAQILNILWNQRFVGYQDDCLYFRFISLLCREFTVTIIHLGTILKIFFQSIYILLNKYVDKSSGGHKEFIQFNTSYLQFKIKKSKESLQYSVIYFATILLQQKEIIKIQKFYYVFIWSQIEKFCFIIRQYLNIFAMRSYFYNQIQYGKSSKRKIFSLCLRIQKMIHNQFFIRLREEQNHVSQIKLKLSKLRKKLGKNNKKYRLIMEHVSKYFRINF